MKNYILRKENGTVKAKVDGNDLDHCLEIANHSPTGFNWGYSGSGPAQLALAIMVSEYGRDLATHPIHYQELKENFVALLNGTKSFIQFTSEDIDKVVRKVKQQKKKDEYGIQ